MSIFADHLVRDAEDMEADVVDAPNFDDLYVSKLQNTQHYVDIIKKVDEALEKGAAADHMSMSSSNQGMVLEVDHPEFQLILDCSSLSADIDNEIITIHNFIRDRYRLKFPELHILVQHPIDYARVVKRIGNEVDLTLVDLEGLLHPAIIFGVELMGSTTDGKPLPDELLRKTIDACDTALALDSARRKVFGFVESRMGYIAPNLSAIVGSAVAAKLMGAAGGLSSLAKMPVRSVQILGARRKNLAGFSTVASRFGPAYIEQTEVHQSTTPALKMRVWRLLAQKCTLAARVDSTSGDPTGSQGRSYREEIIRQIEKWQQPPPAGGLRPRIMKERYGITNMRKMFKRMKFGVPQESSLGDGLGEGCGMLDQAGNGRSRVSGCQSKLAPKVATKFKKTQYGNCDAMAISELASSLGFTHLQGIELPNPQAPANQPGSGTQEDTMT